MPQPQNDPYYVSACQVILRRRALSVLGYAAIFTTLMLCLIVVRSYDPTNDDLLKLGSYAAIVLPLLTYFIWKCEYDFTRCRMLSGHFGEELDELRELVPVMTTRLVARKR